MEENSYKGGQGSEGRQRSESDVPTLLRTLDKWWARMRFAHPTILRTLGPIAPAHIAARERSTPDGLSGKDHGAVIASESEAIQAVPAAGGWIASSRCSSQLNLRSNDGGETLHPGHAQTARRAHFLLRRRANQNHPPARPAPDKEGRFAIVTNVGSGMRWPQCRSRRMPILRTAKSCGPGAPRLALSFAR